MIDEKKQQSAEYRKKTSLNSMYFNRFLWIRYALAIFMFCNLYWAIFSLGAQSIFAILPIFLLIGLATVLFEQVKLYRNHSNELPKTRLFFIGQLAINSLLLISIYTSFYKKLFPFFTESSTTKSMVSFLVLIGIMLCLLTLNKIKIIGQNQDKHFGIIKKYEETLI